MHVNRSVRLYLDVIVFGTAAWHVAPTACQHPACRVNGSDDTRGYVGNITNTKHMEIVIFTTVIQTEVVDATLVRGCTKTMQPCFADGTNDALVNSLSFVAWPNDATVALEN
jgi:hypothetical protein